MEFTRYNNFDKFMLDVVEAANNQHDLYTLFKLDSTEVVAITQKILEVGWWLFIAIVSLLFLSPLAFAVSLGAFLLTSPGLIIATILGVASVVSIKTLYRNKIFPMAIKEVGKQYEPRYKKVLENYSPNSLELRSEIDLLLKKAVNTLIIYQ